MPSKRSDVRVPARLLEHAVPRVDQNQGDVGGRRARDHVPRVLNVTRRVGDDELALVGREVAVGDVDGDALLALGLEAVGEQRKSGSSLCEAARTAAIWSSKTMPVS